MSVSFIDNGFVISFILHNRFTYTFILGAIVSKQEKVPPYVINADFQSIKPIIAEAPSSATIENTTSTIPITIPIIDVKSKIATTYLFCSFSLVEMSSIF